MRVPSLSQTLSYFKGLGFALERVAPDTCPDVDEASWLLVDATGERWGDPFSNLLELWCWWLDHVWHILREQEKIRLFLSAYTHATPSHRLEMRRWLSNYLKEIDETHLTELFAPVQRIRIDRLPRDWKVRIKRRLSVALGGFTFDHTIRPLLDSIDRKAPH